MSEIKNAILAGLVFGLILGLFFALQNDIHYALMVGAISGLAFGTIIYFFVTSKMVKKQTQIVNLDGMQIVHSGGANHFVNSEAVGGKLYLLSDKLHFQSHRFNIQNHGQIIEISKIKEVGFYNTLGLIPNGLAITTVDGQTEKFVVSDRRFWKSEIEKLKAGSK